MHRSFAPHDHDNPTPIWPVKPDRLSTVLDGLGAPAKTWSEAHDFAARPGESLVVPGSDGAISAVLFGLGRDGDPARMPFLPGRLARTLPEGVYQFADHTDDDTLAAIAWGLGHYRFEAYSGKSDAGHARLALPSGVDGADVSRIIDGVYMARDLINTPANDMGPDEIERVVHRLSDSHGAELRVTTGEDLLAANFPLIYGVGKASPRAPRLIDLVWGSPTAPKVTLVGKGVCFDTGGLNLKPGSGMALMKKDMGGAACTIGLAAMIMEAGLNVRLRLLVPAVENAVAGNAFRPGDILPSRHGDTVEIGNTDAEGRLVLADALSLACEEKPDLLIDMATLTGAARVALGPEVIPFYTFKNDLAAALIDHSARTYDPLWQMPLWANYRAMLKSPVATINNAGKGGFAGSITAAIFLANFVDPDVNWVHFDVYGWVPTARPGQPEGGEAQAVRSLYSMISEKYGG
ncbi:MAG: leucyl aminopeptidase family protein [Pseudomonadota bacterium]